MDQRGAGVENATRAVADGGEVKLQLRLEEGPVSGSSEQPVAAVPVGADPVDYDPDKDPAFQKALRQYLEDQGIDRPFSPESIARSREQVFRLENSCARYRDDAAQFDDCTAEQSCTPEGGGTGVYMNVVVNQGTDLNTPWGEPMCVSTEQAEEGGETIELPTFTLEDFRTLAVAPALSTVEPSPDTLKGMHTNVYAVAQPQQFATELGGFPVQVRALPVQYAWNYGDGTSLGPTELSGAPLAPGAWDEPTDTSHVYTRTGDFAVTLTTYFAGEYSIAGGPWLPVAGLNDVTSAPVPVSVWRSTVRNYADDCLENPQGAGC